jgi:sporulation protein YlmC with PRC-barrel domain
VRSADWTYFWFSGYTYQVVEDLVVDDARHLEALLASDRVDNDVAVDAEEVLRVDDAVLILRAPVLLVSS